MKTEPTINMQDEVAKTHIQYGITKVDNYHIGKLSEKYVEQFSLKVKQLKWDNVYSNHYVKDNPLGYRARINEWNISECNISNIKYVLTLAHSKQEDARVYDTLEEAKEYAQSDFERRIKECLIIE